MSAVAEDDCSLFLEVARCFADAVRRSMRVAGEDEEGLPDGLSQTELAQKSAVGRSTLAKYLGGRPDDPPPNPDLDIVCRLADGLGVPPAMLLMRPQDWASLGTGMLTFFNAMTDPAFKALASRLQEVESTTSPRIADAAIEVGRLLATVGDESQTRGSREVTSFQRAAKASIVATAATIPFRKDGVSPLHLPALLTLCTILGTTTTKETL